MTLQQDPGGRRIQPKDMRVQERQPLQERIPLETPYLLYIDPTNACNFKCAFCPTSDPALLKQVGRDVSMMSMDLYKKIIRELKAFPEPLKLLSLYKDGEPLLHKNFVEMVRLANEAGVAERIWTKTNGSLLNPKLNQELVDAGLHTINISVEATSAEGYKKIAKVDIDYDRFRENLADLHARRGAMRIYVKIADHGLPPEVIEQFYEDFQPLCTDIAVEKLMGWSNSGLKDFTLGTNPDTYDGLPLIPKKVCAYPFYVMAVNSNGNVSLCGNDWSHETRVGNVNAETLQEIWYGERLFEFRKMMLEGRRGQNKACGNCYYLQIVPDNLDPYTDMLMGKLQSHFEAKCQP